MLYIFIDESGTLPDPNDKFIVISGVIAANIKDAENLIGGVLKSLRERKIKIKELKFYGCGDRTRRQFLSGMVAVNFDIFTLIVDKKNRKIADTPENFSFLVAQLIQDIASWHKNKNLKILIDRHFYRKTDVSRFNDSLDRQLNLDLSYQIKHIDSQQNLIVNIADMAAGSVLWKYTRKNDSFYNIISDNIIIEKKLNWPELKRKMLKNKNHLNRRKRPSK